jgi:prolipoprotein diacylglyceryl transferase
MQPDSLMDAGNYFVWHGDPVIYTTGVLWLPFILSIQGLILGLVLAFFAADWWLKRLQGQATSKKEKPQKLTEMQYWAVMLVSLLIGQVIFNIIPVNGFDHIGPISLRWYGLLFGGAFLLGYFIGSKEFRDAGRPEAERDALLTYVLIATVIGARLGHVIFYEPEYYLRNLHLVPAIWQGGLASHGAATGVLIAIWLYTRKYKHLSFLWVTDRVVIPSTIGGAFVRLGNFFNSEIYGVPTDVSWAVVFSKVDMLPRHPSMLYEAVLYVVLFAILWAIYTRYKSRPPEGLLFAVFLIIMFTGRFLIEYTKVEQAEFATGWFIGMGQLLSVPFVLVGIWLLLRKKTV